MIKSSPGVTPKPRFGPYLDSTVCIILYSVWHTHGGSEGGRILRHSIAIVLQPCGQCTLWGGVNETRIDSGTQGRERISGKG